MEDNEQNSNSYRKISSYKTKETSIGKTVVLPIFCGMLGSAIVLGACLGIPTIKSELFGTSLTSTNSSKLNTGSTPTNIETISLTNYSDTSIGVAQKVLPSIVGIEVQYSVNSIFGRSQSTTSAEGSGIITTADGYILTNNHIINSSSSSSYYQLSEAEKIIVHLYDQTSYEAKIIGTDSQTDLAVIKIEATGLTPAELGNSDSTKVGEFAMAIGNPLGMKSSVSCGIISALNREVTDSEGTKYVLIQTDAAINSRK